MGNNFILSWNDGNTVIHDEHDVRQQLHVRHDDISLLFADLRDSRSILRLAVRYIVELDSEVEVRVFSSTNLNSHIFAVLAITTR